MQGAEHPANGVLKDEQAALSRYSDNVTGGRWHAARGNSGDTDRRGHLHAYDEDNRWHVRRRRATHRDFGC